MHRNAQAVSRTLRFGTVSAPPAAVDSMRAVAGVISVEQHKKRQRLRTIYDVTPLRWATVCDIMQRAGLCAPRNWWGRWRDGWRDRSDRNMRNNLSHRPPVAAGRRRGAQGIRSARRLRALQRRKPH